MTQLVDYEQSPVKIPDTSAEQHPKSISQGAEALVFLVPESEKIAKYRPAKPWRSKELDDLLRKRRTTQEVRVMQKLAESQIGVPRILWTNASLGLIYMQLIKGISSKQATWDATKSDYKPSDPTKPPEAHDVHVPEHVLGLYRQLGEAISRMHDLNIVHGDLTTSNAMVTPEDGFPDGAVKLIDFGLSSQTPSIEQKAVDLYVLERSIQSTHPLEADILMHKTLMTSYIECGKKLNAKNCENVLTRLEVVRKRGRKRTQLG